MAYAQASLPRLDRPHVRRAERIAEPSPIALVGLEIPTEADVISCKSAMMVAALGLSLSGCSAVISQASFHPSASLAPPAAATDTMLSFGELCAVLDATDGRAALAAFNGAR
jgi:hypothetical protein